MPSRAAIAQSRSHPAGSIAPGGNGVKAIAVGGSAARKQSDWVSPLPPWATPIASNSGSTNDLRREISPPPCSVAFIIPLHLCPSTVTVHRGLSRFSRRKGRHKRIDVLAAKMGLSPLRRERGQVHVFGRRFLRQTRFPAEKWTSPRPRRERLPFHQTCQRESPLRSPPGNGSGPRFRPSQCGEPLGALACDQCLKPQANQGRFPTHARQFRGPLQDSFLDIHCDPHAYISVISVCFSQMGRRVVSGWRGGPSLTGRFFLA